MTEIRRYRLRHRARPLEVLTAGDGEPLVLLHGWGLSGRAYRAPIRALAAAGFRVIAPSVSVSDAWSIETTADLAMEALAGMDASEAIVVGHSFGGVVGVHAALAHPEFVRALLAVNAPLTALNARRLARLAVPGTHYRMAAYGPAAAALVRCLTTRGGVPSLTRSARWLFGAQAEEALRDLARTGIPRAVIWAQGDALLPLDVGQRAAGILDCKLVVVGADAAPNERVPDHDWPFRYPLLFARTIVEQVADLLGGHETQAG